MDENHEKLMNYLIGQVKKKTKGKCSAEFVRSVFEELLECEYHKQIELTRKDTITKV